MASFLIIYLLALGAIGIGSLASYILRGLGILGLSKKLGKPNGWLGFLPLVWRWQYGSLVDGVPLGSRTIRTPGLWMMLISIAQGVLFFAWYVVFFIVALAQTATLSMHDEYAPVGLLVTMLVFGGVAFVVMIASNAAYYGLLSLVHVHLFERFVDRDRALVQLVLCLFVPLYESIYLFFLSGRDPLGGAVTPTLPAPFIPSGNPPY